MPQKTTPLGWSVLNQVNRECMTAQNCRSATQEKADGTGVRSKYTFRESLETQPAPAVTREPALLIKCLSRQIGAMAGDRELNNRKLIMEQFSAVTESC